MAKTSIDQFDTTAANNTDVNAVSCAVGWPSINIGNVVRNLMKLLKQYLANSVSVASASTVDLGAQTGNYITITGTTTITAFGTVAAGTWKQLKFSGALTLTYNATSLILPGAANITTVAGDTAMFVSEGSGNWRCIAYQQVNGNPVFSGTGTAGQVLTSNGAGTAPTYQSVAPTVGSSLNVRMNQAASSATFTMTADEVVLGTALGGKTIKISSLNQACNLGTTGANGMDTGSPPVGGFVSVYAIAKADGTKALLACNVTTSTANIYGGANMPAGYTYSALLCVLPTIASQIPVSEVFGRTTSFIPIQVLNITSSVPTTATSLNISAAVPPGAINCGGYSGSSSTTVDAIHSIQTDSSGAGQIQFSLKTTGTSLNGVASSAPFSLRLAGGQTLYYTGQSGTRPVTIYINEYTM